MDNDIKKTFYELVSGSSSNPLSAAGLLYEAEVKSQNNNTYFVHEINDVLLYGFLDDNIFRVNGNINKIKTSETSISDNTDSASYADIANIEFYNANGIKNFEIKAFSGNLQTSNITYFASTKILNSWSYTPEIPNSTVQDSLIGTSQMEFLDLSQVSSFYDTKDSKLSFIYNNGQISSSGLFGFKTYNDSLKTVIYELKYDNEKKYLFNFCPSSSESPIKNFLDQSEKTPEVLLGLIPAGSELYFIEDPEATEVKIEYKGTVSETDGTQIFILTCNALEEIKEILL